MEGDEWRKVRMTPELMERIVEAAMGRGFRIEWGEPDEEGFYTPAIYRNDTSIGSVALPAAKPH